MPLRHVPFLVGLNRMVKLDVTPQMMISLYAVRVHPGLSYSDIAGKIGAQVPHTYKSLRHLIARELVEDRRVVTNPKTPGVLHVTPAGAAYIVEVMEGNDGGDENYRG